MADLFVDDSLFGNGVLNVLAVSDVPGSNQSCDRREIFSTVITFLILLCTG